jgi:sphinganine-1-phosphate aldolase
MSEEHVRIPKKGTPREKLLAQMRELRVSDARFEEGKLFSLVYQAAREHTEFLKECMGTFFFANGLSPMAFPSVKKFETEVVSMAAGMLGGDGETTGTMTSGGTESLLLAVKTYRDRARAEHPEIKAPEMVLPISVHPAFEKAADYFGVKSIHVPLDADFRADLDAVKKAITPNTIMIAGSAPPYPQGVIDPIPELAAIARERGIGMHVDACVGGFILPWLRKLGHPVPPFDFAVDGVTSISADLHKYGYAARGASTILYRNAELRKYQFFVYTGWPGGYYASPSIPGSRSGGIIAAAWGTMMSFGEDGYMKFAEITLKTAKKFMAGINSIKGLKIIGKPDLTVLSFGSDELDIWSVGDEMEKQGWMLEKQTAPVSLHMVVNPVHADIVDKFLEDLEKSVRHVRENPAEQKQGMAAVYGMLAQIPEKAQVEDFVRNFLDETYKT